ncbi:hypothetical protein JCM10213_007589 [Rhodosporidiobolus nylandii]
MAPSRIVIVGGGIIGASSAFQLATLAQQRGDDVKITLVEGSSIAAGSSGKAGGLLALDWHGPDTADLARLSYSLHASLAAEHGGADRWGYRKLDTLSVSADLSSPSGFAKPRQRKVKHADLFPWLSQDVLRGAEILGSTETTAQVHPELFTKAMVELAEEKGVEVVFGTASSLQKPSTSAKPYTLTITPRDSPSSSPLTLEADKLLVTAGPWTGRLLGELGLKQGAGRAKSIRGSRAHSVVLKTAPGRDLPAQALFTSIKTKEGGAEPEIYNRPDGTAYACGPTDNTDLPLLASDVSVSPSAITSLLSQTAQLAPDYLSTENGEYSATVERRQACYLPVGSGDPVIGCIEGGGERGVWVGSGHSCWGICNGPGTGLVLAEMMLNKDGRATSADVDALMP